MFSLCFLSPPDEISCSCPNISKLQTGKGIHLAMYSRSARNKDPGEEGSREIVQRFLREIGNVNQ